MHIVICYICAPVREQTEKRKYLSIGIRNSVQHVGEKPLKLTTSFILLYRASSLSQRPDKQQFDMFLEFLYVPNPELQIG